MIFQLAHKHKTLSFGASLTVKVTSNKSSFFTTGGLRFSLITERTLTETVIIVNKTLFVYSEAQVTLEQKSHMEIVVADRRLEWESDRGVWSLLRATLFPKPQLCIWLVSTINYVLTYSNTPRCFANWKDQTSKLLFPMGPKIQPSSLRPWEDSLYAVYTCLKI